MKDEAKENDRMLLLRGHSSEEASIEHALDVELGFIYVRPDDDEDVPDNIVSLDQLRQAVDHWNTLPLGGGADG